MATPTTLKKLEEKKQAAQNRRDKNTTDQLLPLGTMNNAPSAHLLVRENPNPAPRMMDLRLRPLSAQFMKYREPKINFAADPRPGGRDYTSFESNEIDKFGEQKPQGNIGKGYQNLYGNFKRRYGGSKPAVLKNQTVESIPDDMPAVEYTVHANNLVCFHGKEHFLSSLYPVDITIDGHLYSSVEHYYQACKIFSLVNPGEAQQLRDILDPLKVKQKAKDILRKWGVDNNTVENWKKSEGLGVLLHAIRHKFTESEMRKKILATGDALLCQAYDRDSMYAVGMTEQQLREWAQENEGKVLKFPLDLNTEKVKYLPMVGRGKNVLGVICMQVRKVIQDFEADQQQQRTQLMAGEMAELMMTEENKSVSSSGNSTSSEEK